MRFIFEQIRTGGDRNFAYLIGDREAGEGVLVDPSYDPDAVVERSRVQGLTVTHVINTHGHPDHVNGNDRALELTGARLAAYKDAESDPGVSLDDGDELKVGSLSLRFLYTPGHSFDHLVIYLPGQAVAITGDLLFVGKIGGTANDELALEEYESIQRVLGWRVQGPRKVRKDVQKSPLVQCLEPTSRAHLHKGNVRVGLGVATTTGAHSTC